MKHKCNGVSPTGPVAITTFSDGVDVDVSGVMMMQDGDDGDGDVYDDGDAGVMMLMTVMAVR